LLQVSVVVVVVAIAGLVIALAVPGVHHLMVLGKKGKTEIPRNPTICTRDMGKMLSFYLS
jgi:hypothetical protein